ncbi:MAG: DUF4194 domain-containing protein [Eubacteriales bacterium]|nr:DUF4194 domain-containing protein [Eubacteriales bacterium]
MVLFEDMHDRDIEEFKRVCNRLMSMCFINKQNASTKSDYYFIIRHKTEFMQYLDVLGFSLDINEHYGAVQLVNREGYNHARLKLAESIILLILRVIYDEKKRELSLGDVVINIGDIQEKYISMRIRDKQIDKTTMSNTLQLFKRYNILELLDRDLTQEDARIVIYDSILMAVRVDDIKRVNELLDKYRKGAADENTEEGAPDKLAQISE